MIDIKFSIKRYVSEFSNETEELISEYDLETFDLVSFQAEFKEASLENPMVDCFPILETNIRFIESYLDNTPNWDFEKNSYFVEAKSN